MPNAAITNETLDSQDTTSPLDQAQQQVQFWWDALSQYLQSQGLGYRPQDAATAAPHDSTIQTMWSNYQQAVQDLTQQAQAGGFTLDPGPPPSFSTTTVPVTHELPITQNLNVDQTPPPAPAPAPAPAPKPIPPAVPPPVTTGGATSGGGGSAGTSVPSITPMPVDPNVPNPQTDPEGYIRAKFPELIPFLNIPDLKNIILEGAKNGYDASRIQGMLEASDWWRQRADATRQWETLIQTQPQEALQRRDNKAQDIKMLGQSMGLVISDDQAQGLADAYLRYGWDDNVLKLKLQLEPQFRDTTEAERQWDLLNQTNPGEANARRQQTKIDIQNEAAKLGVTVPDGVLNDIVENSLKFGWDNTMVTNQIVANLSLNSATGAAVTSETDLKKAAGDWGFTPDANELTKWMQGIANGTLTQQDYTADLQNRALQMYGGNSGLAEAISRGISPQQFFQPYAQIASQELGVSPDSLNWKDPKWQVALNYNDPKTGILRPMNSNEFQNQIRSDPQYGWRYSDTANQMASTFQQKALQTFGQVQ